MSCPQPGMWQTIYILATMGLLLLEWWLPRKTDGRINSTIDLVTGFFCVLVIGAMLAWVNFRNKGDEK